MACLIAGTECLPFNCDITCKCVHIGEKHRNAESMLAARIILHSWHVDRPGLADVIEHA